jgi:DNA-directed RNA polymerase specialized sigma24 family protein
MAEQLHIPSPDEPEEALASVVALRRLADRLERAAVDEAVRQGWTWARIAEALGVTRQAVHKRHAGRHPDTTRKGGR